MDYFRGIRAVDECSTRALEITAEVRMVLDMAQRGAAGALAAGQMPSQRSSRVHLPASRPCGTCVNRSRWRLATAGDFAQRR